MEGPATLIAHRGKADAAFRHSGLTYKIAAGDLKIGRVVDAACIHSLGKQAAGDGKRGATSFDENLAVKQAVADGDGSVIIRKLHTLFKGSALDRGIVAGGDVYLDSFLKDAAGDGAAVVIHRLLEGAAGDVFGVVHRSLEGAVGDGAVVVHLPLEGAVGDGFVVVHIPLEGAAGDGLEVSHLPLEGAAGDGAIIVGFTADGAAD